MRSTAALILTLLGATWTAFGGLACTAEPSPGSGPATSSTASSASASASASPSTSASLASGSSSAGFNAVFFEENTGRYDPRVRFVARGRDGTIFIEDGAFSVVRHVPSAGAATLPTLLASVSALLLVSGGANAARWVGGVSNAYENGANWDTGVVPLDVAVIPARRAAVPADDGGQRR